MFSRKVFAVVSLDGFDDSHNAFRVDARGKPVTQSALRGLRTLLKAKVPTAVSVVVSRANIASLSEITQFLIKAVCSFHRLRDV